MVIVKVYLERQMDTPQGDNNCTERTVEEPHIIKLSAIVTLCI